MSNEVKAVIVDDETIFIDGRTLVGMDEVADALTLIFQSDPNFILVIEPTKNDYYRGIGIVIYASQRVGVPVENICWPTDDSDVRSLSELKHRDSSLLG